ncbi:MAG: NUDIX domain-containing protein [bacterium]|nr:NUDIX domain-containing protein [bacterium]
MPTRPTVTDNQWFQVSLKLLLQNEAGETLILKCPDDSSLAGFYDLPGGRIAATEKELPFAEIIKREVTEELGSAVNYELESTKPIAIGRHHYPSKKMQQEVYLFWVLFGAQYQSGAINLSNEHQSYQWVKLTAANLEQYFIRGPLDLMNNYQLNRKP